MQSGTTVLAPNSLEMNDAGSPFSVLNAYFDASGSHSGSKLLTFGGLIGSARDWDEFAVDWSVCLERHNLREFHAVHCVNQTGEFRDRSFAERLGIMGDFIDVLIERNLLHIASIVLMDDWNKLSPIERRRLDDPWIFGFEFSVQQSVNWTRRANPKGFVGFVLDIENPQVQQKALATFQHYKASHKWHSGLAGISFDSSERVLPLQAADLFAYGINRRETIKLYPRKEDFPVVKAFERLTHDFAKAGGIYDLAAFRELLGQMRAKEGSKFKKPIQSGE